MNKFTKSLYLTFIYFFFYLPIAVVIIFSFNSASRSLLWKGFSLKWYYELFKNHELLIVMLNSIILGVFSATISTIIGTLSAIIIFRYKFMGRKVLRAIIFMLIMSPEIVMGISLLILYSFLNISLGFLSLLLGHIALSMPFVAVTVYGRIATFDKAIFESAKDLGANDFIILKKIIIPLLLPAIIAGWLLSFTLSFDDIIVSYFIAGPTFNILPLKIYSMVKLGVIIFY